MSQMPSIPKGTRDFSPLQMRRRNYIFDTIRNIFFLHSYLPIETPAMENLSTLLGKYGEEGDKLLFKILNSGDFWQKASSGSWDDMDAAQRSVKLGNLISEKGLRYDLTVPFARYVVQHRNDIVFPFKRYQMQTVWRADRPQKGRYREFYQCDADVVGSDSLWQEAELAQIVDEVFSAFGIPVVLKINNRKILSAMSVYAGCENFLSEMTVAIDKLDKMGLDAVKTEMEEKGIAEDSLLKILPVLELKGDFESKMNYLKNIFKNNEVGLKGIAELEELFGYIALCAPNLKYEWDLTLARGLNYYTGAIFEVKAIDVEMGSISGGGRYDDLTGIFGLKDVSGVGISFGADRIYDVLESMNAFPDTLHSAMSVMFVNFGDEDVSLVQQYMKELRVNGISCDRYPIEVKLQKQFSYADKLNVPYIVMLGEKERQSGNISVKNMNDGSQKEMLLSDLIRIVKQNNN